MLTIISDASIANAISTNQLLAVAHRLLADYMDEPSFNKVCIVRYGAGFMGRALRVELTRQPDRKIAENWEWAGAEIASEAVADVQSLSAKELAQKAFEAHLTARVRAALLNAADPVGQINFFPAAEIAVQTMKEVVTTNNTTRST